MDTIFAVSSGAPPAAIAIIRLSGSLAILSATALAGPLPPDRRVGVRALSDPRDGRLLDRAVVLVFAGPRTATGEDVVELHVHGGRAVVAAIEDMLAALPGLRRAEPGEFTRRALLNNVIDLSEAEGLGDLLAAETETQRRAALRNAEGGLRAVVEGWRSRLVEIAAQIEAQLDFSDEDDVGESNVTMLTDEIGAVTAEIARALAEPPVERLKDGIRVVLAGPPNSGKSTLLNALADRDIAIVSPISGTTRDRIEAPVTRQGVAYILIDTAGLAHQTTDAVEAIGIARAHAAITEADLLLWLGDDAPPSNDAIWVHARADLPGRVAMRDGCDVAVSATSGAGVRQLWSMIAASGAGLLPSESALTTNARQRSALNDCFGQLVDCRDKELLLVAEHLRSALGSLDRVVGRAGIENVLDALFARFCVGK